MQVRSALREDLDALASVFTICFNAPPWNERWESAAARERLGPLVAAVHFRGVVALLDERIVGFALGQKERWVDSFHFNLQEMCVLPQHQRSGVGRSLLEHLTAQLRSEGTEKIYLITSPNGDAAAFYAKQGFYTSRGRVVMARASSSGE